ncbi:MAG: hypothetical protein FWH41_01455 [Treponema sp.]|nr:hypothetical protein [Treponema sp.]
MEITLSVISISLCVLCFFFSRWYIKRNTSASQLLAEYRSEVYRLIAEIDAATDRDSLLVEERIKILKSLLDDTEKRIGVYVKELQRSRNAEAVYANLGKGIRSALVVEELPDSKPAALPVDLKEKTANTNKAKKTQNKNEGIKKEGIKNEGRKNEGRKEDIKNKSKKPQDKKTIKKIKPIEAEKPALKVQIAQLSAQGLNPAEIASRLDLSIAEVELALNLLYRR